MPRGRRPSVGLPEAFGPDMYSLFAAGDTARRAVPSVGTRTFRIFQ